jgi:hypothetical protein
VRGLKNVGFTVLDAEALRFHLTVHLTDGLLQPSSYAKSAAIEAQFFLKFLKNKTLTWLPVKLIFGVEVEGGRQTFPS